MTWKIHYKIFWVLDLWPESLISAGGISNPLIIKPQIRMVQKVYDQCSKILISSKGFEKSICEKGDYKDKLVYFPNWAEDVKGECPADFDINKIEPFATKKEMILSCCLQEMLVKRKILMQF